MADSEPEKPKRASWKAGIVLTVISTVICFAAAELYFRWTTPYVIRKNTVGPAGITVTSNEDDILSGEYGFFMDTFHGRRLIPDSHVLRVNANGVKVPIDINKQGFRGEDIPLDKEKDEVRILFLGDSITIGADIPIEKTFTKRAEELLNAKRRKGSIRCINGGVEGIGTKDEIDILLDQGLKVSPDIVVIGFFLNDGNPPDRLAAGLANPGFVRRHSVLAQTIYRAYKYEQLRRGDMEEARIYSWMKSPEPPDWRTNRDSLLRYAKVAVKDWGAAWEPAVWSGIDKEFDRLAALAREHNITVILLSFPIAYQVYAEYLEDEPQKRVKALADRHHFPVLDLLPVFRTRADNELFLDYYHLNELGHDVTAKAVAAFLRNTRFVSRHGLIETMQ